MRTREDLGRTWKAWRLRAAEPSPDELVASLRSEPARARRWGRRRTHENTYASLAQLRLQRAPLEYAPEREDRGDPLCIISVQPCYAGSLLGAFSSAGLSVRCRLLGHPRARLPGQDVRKRRFGCSRAELSGVQRGDADRQEGPNVLVRPLPGTWPEPPQKGSFDSMHPSARPRTTCSGGSVRREEKASKNRRRNRPELGRGERVLTG